MHAEMHTLSFLSLILTHLAVKYTGTEVRMAPSELTLLVSNMRRCLQTVIGIWRRDKVS